MMPHQFRLRHRDGRIWRTSLALPRPPVLSPSRACCRNSPDTRSQCPVILPGREADGQIPLYVGIFPEEEDWEWKVEFKNDENHTFFRLSLQSEREQIKAQSTSGLYGETQSPPVEWSEAAFPVREWSHLAVYADGDHLVVAQRQDASAATVRVGLDKHSARKFRFASDGNMTHNCLKGLIISSVSEVLQVTENKTYCLQAAGPPVTLSGDNASLEVTNATWHRIEEQAESYSVDGVIFVIDDCPAKAFISTTLAAEGISTTTAVGAQTTSTSDFTSPTTHQPEQSESSPMIALLSTIPSRSQDADTEGRSYTSSFSSTLTQSADNAESSTPVEELTEPSGGPSEKSSGEASEEPSGEPSGKPTGPSKGAVAAVVISIIILLLTVIFFFRRGYHREVLMLWYNATHREEQTVEILNLQKGGSLRQKENNE
ncbi:hypothetical protein C7M84_016370 [Penaeus vannamei]|uniref:Uncharacterized protein n=1 Tax=Penaeus vannamei TaxID=6689 RepID=A0A423SNB4_PENVA|nr:hypothetical protein C7M84_016370 [Penaeus vannamei]